MCPPPTLLSVPQRARVEGEGEEEEKQGPETLLLEFCVKTNGPRAGVYVHADLLAACWYECAPPPLVQLHAIHVFTHKNLLPRFLAIILYLFT